MSVEPLNAEQIADAPRFDRDRATMGPKEPQARRRLALRRFPGGRHGDLEASQDVREVFRALAGRRQRRDSEPTPSLLRGALLHVPAVGSDRVAQRCVKAAHDPVGLTASWLGDVRRPDRRAPAPPMTTGAKAQRLPEFTGKASAAGAKE